MKSQQAQIDELRAKVDRLTRELARVTSREAKIRTPRVGIVLGKTDAAHDKDDDGTVSVYGGTPLSEADTGINITAYNKDADDASGKWVVCVFVRRAWYLISAEFA
jgi:hypothetical protein